MSSNIDDAFWLRAMVQLRCFAICVVEYQVVCLWQAHVRRLLLSVEPFGGVCEVVSAAAGKDGLPERAELLTVMGYDDNQLWESVAGCWVASVRRMIQLRCTCMNCLPQLPLVGYGTSSLDVHKFLMFRVML